MIYLTISTILLILGVVIIYWIHNQYHLDIVVTPVQPPQQAPLISVCIPARNEEDNIRKCVEATLYQDYPNLEVIVVDDRSTDETLEILLELASLLAKRKEQAPSLHTQLKIINGSDLPDGWAGKPHALYQASAVARGEWLCFVDADTFLAPNAISACYAKALETKADLFTTLHRQITETFWEKVVMPLVMTSLSVGFSPRKVNDPKRRDAVANGQFILIKQSVYDAIGGHEKIKDHIVEDKAISEQVKWNGYRLIIADGFQVISTRMYTSFETMWEGWTKNIYLGLREQPALLFLGAFGASLGLVAALFLPIWPLLGLGWFLLEKNWMPIIVILEALLAWGYLFYQRVVVNKRMNVPASYVWTTPLGAGIFAGLIFSSAWKVISGPGVTWRGRRYQSK